MCNNFGKVQVLASKQRKRRAAKSQDQNKGTRSVCMNEKAPSPTKKEYHKACEKNIFVKEYVISKYCVSLQSLF